MSEQEKMGRDGTDTDVEVSDTPTEEAVASEKKAENKPKKDKDKAEKNKKVGLGTRFSRFLREMKAELKKVSWPTRNDTLKKTGVVIVCVVIVGVIVWVFDGIANNVISALLSLFGR